MGKNLHAVPVVPVAGAANHKTNYAASRNTSGNPNAPRQINPAHSPVRMRQSLHQSLPTKTSMGLDSALEGLDAMDFSERRITSDISTLDCNSVKADPHFNPAVEETPFVPPLDIEIPVNLSHLALQQQQQLQIHRNRHVKRSSLDNGDALLRGGLDLTRRSSCQSRLEMSQGSPNHRSRSKSLLVSHKMAIKLATNNGGVLPPSYHSTEEQQEGHDYDASLEDYANGAGAVTWDGDSGDQNSRLSYYTSPTDLCTSEDSEPIVQNPTKGGVVKQKLNKIMFRFKNSTSKSKKSKTLEPQHVVEGAVKDYDSFGSERGFC